MEQELVPALVRGMNPGHGHAIGEGGAVAPVTLKRSPPG